MTAQILSLNSKAKAKLRETYDPAVTEASPNTPEFENSTYVKPTGFREYDVRWIYPEQINLKGIQALGAALGTQMFEQNKEPEIVIGHDYRSYSAAVKQALIAGFVSAGIKVVDIGLCLSPVAYFAQFFLDIKSVAMVTASHNENGWTGVKVGFNRPLTHGPEDMTRLKEIVLGGQQICRDGGRHIYYDNIREAYLSDFRENFSPCSRKIKAVVATGNGTAGLFAVEALENLGVEVVPLNTELDYNFPNYNPNPEDMTMLHDMAECVKQNNADIGLAFDGDGDRCGIVDHTGREIFADKAGLMLARNMVKTVENPKFVVDVKSTGLFLRDEVLQNAGATTEYWKTGHSYMKRRVTELSATAGFEKSGHYFIGAPYGRGYDDGILSAILMCKLLDENPEKSIADMYNDLPVTYLSPTMSPYCADEIKYEIIDKVVAKIKALYADKSDIAGRSIEAITDVNGIRFTLSDGSWGLVRASSNKPNLVVVTESTRSEQDMKDIFREIDAILSDYEEVGEYDQKI
ncbi:MAG: phosphomannomutase/phosphoglucomutase [Pseudomonadota bacterium]